MTTEVPPHHHLHLHHARTHRTGQSDWWPLLTVHAPSGMQPSPAYLRSGQAAQSGGLGLPPPPPCPRSLIPNKWEVHELHFVRANLGLARRPPAVMGRMLPAVALPGPDLPYAGSTEPFDGTERLAVSFKFTFTWHPEFIPRGRCFQKVATTSRAI